MRLVILVFVFLYSLNVYAQKEIGIVDVGQGMPEFSIIHDNGTKLTIGPYLNKVILINFFATWCGPCQQELAEIEKYIWPEYKEYADFVLLVIGVGHTDAELKEYKEKKNFSFPLYPDEVGEIFNTFALGETIPRTYLVDKSNHIIYLSEGFSPAEFASLRKKLREVFQEEPFYDDPLQTEE